MNWITIAWPMVAAACLTLMLVHLRIAFGDGRRLPHLFFSVAAAAVAIISGCELALLRTDDLVRYQTILRWAAVPIAIMVVSVIGFVWAFFGTGRKWLAIGAVSLISAAELANLISPVPMVRNAIAIHRVQGLGGVWFTVPTIASTPWTIVEIASVVLAVAFVWDASVKLWKTGEHQRAAVVGGGIIFFFCASRGHAFLVEKGIVQTPYLVSFAFLGVILAMAHELSADVLRSVALVKQLRESEGRASLAARAAALGFWNWDIARDEIWASAGARAVFGVSLDEKLDLQIFLGLVHPDDREAVRDTIQKALTGDGDYRAQYRIRLQDGRIRWIDAHGRIEFDTARKPVLISGAVADITERRASESELQHLRGQLAHVARVSTMGQLAASVAHELNQPLGAILSNAEAAELFLAQNPPALGELRGILEDIRNDDERASEVIRRMRALLHKGELERKPLEINPLVEDVLRLLSADAALRKTTITADLSSGLPVIQGDRIHLQQVLLNLILNGFDAMGSLPVEKRRLSLRTNRSSEGGVEVTVVDCGPGVVPDKLPHLFEPFYSTKPNGMGMGLSIARTIIEAHHGRITAENNVNGGATFRFVLPAATETGKS